LGKGGGSGACSWPILPWERGRGPAICSWPPIWGRGKVTLSLFAFIPPLK